jgi:hypothetical protein
MVYITSSLAIRIFEFDNYSVTSSWLLNDKPYMPKMPSSTVVLSTNYVNARFQKVIKALLRIFLINVQVSFDKSLQLSEELFNWIKIGEYGGRYTSFTPTSRHICSICSV